MARYTFTLTLGGLTVTLRPEVAGWQRSIIEDSQARLDGFTPNGAPLFSGPNAFTRRYSWAYSGLITEQQALIIEAIARAQTPSTLATLTDEYYYLEPTPGTVDKPILSGSQITVQTGYVTGLFQGAVWVQLPPEHKRLLGGNDCTYDRTKTFYELTMALLEVPA